VRKPTTTLGVAGLKQLAILVFESEEIALLYYKMIEGCPLSI